MFIWRMTRYRFDKALILTIKIIKTGCINCASIVFFYQYLKKALDLMLKEEEIFKWQLG